MSEKQTIKAMPITSCVGCHFCGSTHTQIKGKTNMECRAKRGVAYDIPFGGGIPDFCPLTDYKGVDLND